MRGPKRVAKPKWEHRRVGDGASTEHPFPRWRHQRSRQERLESRGFTEQVPGQVRPTTRYLPSVPIHPTSCLHPSSPDSLKSSGTQAAATMARQGFIDSIESPRVGPFARYPAGQSLLLSDMPPSSAPGVGDDDTTTPTTTSSHLACSNIQYPSSTRHSSSRGVHP
jgi:hypothetical protein